MSLFIAQADHVLFPLNGINCFAQKCKRSELVDSRTQQCLLAIRWKNVLFLCGAVVGILRKESITQ